MALTKVVNTDAMGDARPSKSALQTFANILNMGTSLANLAGNANSTFNPSAAKPLYQGAPSGTYSLGMNLDLSQGGTPSAWQDTLQHPFFSNVGQQSNPIALNGVKTYTKNQI